MDKDITEDIIFYFLSYLNLNHTLHFSRDFWFWSSTLDFDSINKMEMDMQI